MSQHFLKVYINTMNLLFFDRRHEINTQYCLHIDEIISIFSEEDSESFAILQSIFSYKKNNQHFIFIAINRFEITNQIKLICISSKLYNIYYCFTMKFYILHN